ncbi:MAG: CHAT domain-containing protein, partial [Candidatus Omnitrophica bacterium]|nr:CHAT domain-containing protein [Candidatus Omnitrophota bacterium]
PSAKEKETFHIEFGKELYTKMFSGELGDYLERCHKDAKNNSETLRIYLRFDESTQKIAALPWEFLHNGDTFLVAKRNTVISRLPSGVNKSKFRPLESILRMLVVVSSPDDPRTPPLNAELEQEVILEGVDPLYRENKIEVDFTEDASFETIGSYLIEKDYHIVHFTGHGTYKDGKGYLCLETEDAKARMVDNRSIADLLADRGVRLVVLSACVSGKVSNKEAYTDLASILVKENIPAVVAMQYPILDISVIQFTSVFYKTLASGMPVDLALAEARIAMKNTEKSNGVDFATPVLYLSDPDCIKIDEIKPVTSELLHRPQMLLNMQVMDKGFVGRRKELRLLHKGFKSDVKRAAIIHGFGGIGKTVLASRFALNMDKHFIGIFGMKCTATTTPADILNELNAFLNLAGVQEFNQLLYGQVPLKVKTFALVNILNQRRFLIILDNFEDCLDETKSDIADPELKEFIQHLLNNTRTNTKFIITTRYNFDPLEGRLTGTIEHISLTELPFPQSVWIMNNHSELAELDIKKKHRIYESIGGHPWTIGVFAKYASAGTVDSLLMKLEPVKKELIDFTLLDKSYAQLDKQAKTLLLKASVYKETVPEEALMWIMGDQDHPSSSVGNALEMLINWGLMAREQHRDEILFAMHTLVKDFARQETEKEQLDRTPLLIRAAQYYENLVKTTRNIWDHLKAREYYYEAGEWEKANQIVASTYQYLVRWGYIELGMNLLDQSIKTTSGATQAAARGELA